MDNTAAIRAQILAAMDMLSEAAGMYHQVGDTLERVEQTINGTFIESGRSEVLEVIQRITNHAIENTDRMVESLSIRAKLENEILPLYY